MKATSTPTSTQSSPLASGDMATERESCRLAAAGSIGAGLLGIACLAWCALVHLQSSPAEIARAVGGVLALWAPVGCVVYLLLAGCCTHGASRFTMSWVASYTLTTAAHAAAGRSTAFGQGWTCYFTPARRCSS